MEGNRKEEISLGYLQAIRQGDYRREKLFEYKT